jgi:hypothetical protein
MLMSNTLTVVYKPQISVLLKQAVVNISYFQSCHFLDIKALLSRELSRHLSQGVAAVHSAKDR